MIPRAAAWATGFGLAIAMALMPGIPASAADPLPPCTIGALSKPILPGLPGVALIPLLPGVAPLPGVAYCDPGLQLPVDPPAPLQGLIPGPVDGIIGSIAGGDGLSLPLPEPVAPAAPAVPPPVLDTDAPVFTQPAAQAGAASLEISGLQSVGIVLVRTISGAQVPVIRIEADMIAIDGFTLDVRPNADSDAAVNDSDRMELDGDVRVYLQSLTATGPDGVGISLLAPTPVPGDELPPALLRVTFGLVGAIADSSDWVHTDLRVWP